MTNPLPAGAQKASLTNERITNAFMAVAGTGMALALGAEGMRWAAHFNIIDPHALSSGAEFFKDSVKGMGQGMAYTSIVNGAAMQLGVNKGFKERDYEKATVQDRSVIIGALCMLGNIAWEGFTAIARSTAIDMNDIGTVSAGVATVILGSKLLEHAIKADIDKNFVPEPVAAPALPKGMSGP